MREAIKRIGGTLPENIAPAEHIKLVEKRIETTPPHLELAEHDAKGLLGEQSQEEDTEKRNSCEGQH